MEVDDEDNLYILFGVLGGIQKFSPDGVYLGSWGRAGQPAGAAQGRQRNRCPWR